MYIPTCISIVKNSELRSFFYFVGQPKQLNFYDLFYCMDGLL